MCCRFRSVVVAGVTVSWLGYISKADRTLLKDVKHTLSYKYKHNTQNHSRQT